MERVVEPAIRLLALADSHLGFDLPRSPRVPRPRRGPDFFRNFELALRPALAGQVDVVVHGGDLLFRSRVPDALLEAALRPLFAVAEAGVPVVVVPGNHERSRLAVPLHLRHPRLFVLDAPRTVILEARGLRLAVGGFPYAPEVRRRFPGLLAATGLSAARADVRVLCLHQCIEGATCGPVGYTFRDGEDVVRAADLPRDVALVLSGHVHRFQALAPPGGPHVIYPGSIERTSFAERDEPKGCVLLSIGARGVVSRRFRPLPTRPMIERALPADVPGLAQAEQALAQALASLPEGALVRLRFAGVPSPVWRTAACAEARRALAPPDVICELAWPRA